jgi:hypothetical protein
METLKKGLAKLRHQIRDRKAALEGKLKARQPISLPISSLVHPTDAMDNPAAHAEMLVKNALDDLEATGALQPSNRMDITGLLNPAIENCQCLSRDR